mmetsp:Transcript_50461/g.141230  ORF Transcript_50461/g.141230 Transcript_50461/m.141230 type:complete len:135 (-) Transcript_50461:790-1194(-)
MDSFGRIREGVHRGKGPENLPGIGHARDALDKRGGKEVARWQGACGGGPSNSAASLNELRADPFDLLKMRTMCQRPHLRGVVIGGAKLCFPKPTENALDQVGGALLVNNQSAYASTPLPVQHCYAGCHRAGCLV